MINLFNRIPYRRSTITRHNLTWQPTTCSLLCYPANYDAIQCHQSSADSHVGSCVDQHAWYMTLFVAQNSTLQQDYKLVTNIRGLIALSHTIIVEIKNVPLVYGWQTVYTKTERDNYTNPGTTFITGVPTTVYVPTKEPYLQIERSSTVISAITLERPWSRMWQEHGP